MTHLIRFSSIALILMTTSCTAIFIPKKQNVQFNTDNDSTEVVIDGENIGKGKSFEYKIQKILCAHRFLPCLLFRSVGYII